MNSDALRPLKSSSGPPLIELISVTDGSDRVHLDSHRNSTSHLDKKIRDEWLRSLGSKDQFTIWAPQDFAEAKKLPKSFKKIADRQEKIAAISGTLAGTTGAIGMVPTVGPLLGIPPAFMANYYGTYEGAELGFDYARLCDLRQDLYKDSEKLYTALAIRLLDRYIKASSAEKADVLEKEHLGKVTVMDAVRKEKLLRKKAEIQELAKSIQNNLPELEKQSVETIWGHKLRRRSPEEVIRDAEKAKEPKSVTGKAIKALTTTELDQLYAKRQEQIAKMKKEIENATLPLKEVCKYIAGEQHDFSVVILHNERDTMTLRCEHELEKKLRAGLDAIRDKETNELRHTVSELMEANKALMAELQRKKERKHHHHKSKHHESKHHAKKTEPVVTSASATVEPPAAPTVQTS